jgi:hypothetical protein
MREIKIEQFFRVHPLYTVYIVTLYNLSINGLNIHFIDFVKYIIRRSVEPRYFPNIKNKDEKS